MTSSHLVERTSGKPDLGATVVDYCHYCVRHRKLFLPNRAKTVDLDFEGLDFGALLDGIDQPVWLTPAARPRL